MVAAHPCAAMCAASDVRLTEHEPTDWALMFWVGSALVMLAELFEPIVQIAKGSPEGAQRFAGILCVFLAWIRISLIVLCMDAPITRVSGRIQAFHVKAQHARQAGNHLHGDSRQRVVHQTTESRKSQALLNPPLRFPPIRYNLAHVRREWGDGIGLVIITHRLSYILRIARRHDSESRSICFRYVASIL